MRAAAMSVWIFINLICFGMCGYLYLIWSQYWIRMEKQKYSDRPSSEYRSSFDFQPESNHRLKNASISVMGKFRRSAVGAWRNSRAQAQSSGAQSGPSSNVVMKTQGRPRFPNVHKPILEFDSDIYVCDDFSTPECEGKTEEYKDLLIKEFHRVLMEEGNVFKSGLDAHNPYKVEYQGPASRVERSGHEVLCALRRVPLRTVSADDEPFRAHGFRISREVLQPRRRYNSCAVVTSAGALLGSRLGEFIDSHDMVLRFNNAPTEEFTDDVGTKTTFRVLNSQVVAKPEFKFLEDAMFANKSILIWDPANYAATLTQWFRRPDFPLFPVYKRLLERSPNADVHLLRPEVLWQLWAVLQDSSPYRLRRNPPSSGFIGLWFSLHRCKRVRMFEYVPSARASRRCHYYMPRNDTSCTLGAWHPLAQEKTLAERMRDNPDLDVFQRGFIDVPGFTSVEC